MESPACESRGFFIKIFKSKAMIEKFENKLESVYERMDGLNKGINLIQSELRTMCNQYYCELRRDGCLCWVVPNSTETIPSDILDDMKIKASVVLTTLLENKNNLEKQYPELSNQSEGYSYLG